MKEYDIVEVIVEKEKYAKEGVHKGMQGIIRDVSTIDKKFTVHFDGGEDCVDS
ncbi:MAG: hypothetical protein HDT29_04835 [Clostridiales bacterium]|nr:hypothetical protein [Clostridiales bacterium]